MTILGTPQSDAVVDAAYVLFASSDIDWLPEWTDLSYEERRAAVNRLVLAYPGWSSGHAMEYLQGMLDGASDTADVWFLDHYPGYRAAFTDYNGRLTAKRTYHVSTQWGDDIETGLPLQVLMCDRCGRAAGIAQERPQHHRCRWRQQEAVA